MDLGKIGVWTWLDHLSAKEAAEFAQRAEGKMRRRPGSRRSEDAGSPDVLIGKDGQGADPPHRRVLGRYRKWPD